jgi:hypothetical protein
MKALQEQQQKQQQDNTRQVVQPGTWMCKFPVMCFPTYFAPIKGLWRRIYWLFL